MRDEEDGNVENRARVMQENVVSNMTDDGYAFGQKEMLSRKSMRGNRVCVRVCEGHQAKTAVHSDSDDPS